MAVSRTQREIRQRAPWLFIGLMVVSFVLMGLSARNDASNQSVLRTWAQAVASPFQRFASGIGGSGVGIFQRLGGLRSSSSDNDQLRQQVAQLQTELQQNHASAQDNERLREILKLKQESKFSPIPARVIARDPSGWFDTIVIDQGRMAGIENSMPVVTPDGIVGRVVATSPLTAQVMLLTDQRAAAGAIVGQVSQSSALGSVRGLGENGLLEMRYVPGLEKVEIGDTVFTTGQDEIYPPGFKVGTVVEIKLGSATVPHVIHLKPSARLAALQEVVVLQFKPPIRPPLDQALPNVDKKK